MSANQANPVAVLGIPVDNVSMADVLGRVQDWVKVGGFHQIATANTDFLINAIKDEELAEILRRCDLVMADGMPLVWTSQLIGAPLKGRVTGADLVPQLMELSACGGYRIFLLGGTEASLDGTMAWIQEHHPKAHIAGRYSPPYASLENMDHEEILARIHSAKPDILLVAFGNPKQEKWLAMHRHRLQVPVCVGVGASFDFLAGAVTRAPRWMQRSGLEWFYRVMQEPKRLSRRYIRNAYGLARHLPTQLATYAVQGKQSLLPQVTVNFTDEACILRMTGDFAGPVVRLCEEKTTDALSNGSHLVIDLSRCSYIGPDALGLLIRVTDLAKLLKCELWLTGLKPLVLRAIRGARPGPTLRVAPEVSEAMRRIEPAELSWQVAQRNWTTARPGTRVIPFADTTSAAEQLGISHRAVAV